MGCRKLCYTSPPLSTLLISAHLVFPKMMTIRLHLSVEGEFSHHLNTWLESTNIYLLLT